MEKINIAELLKDCPKGMELDCTMFDSVKFDGIDAERFYPIRIKIGGNKSYLLTEYGQWNNSDDAKCVIFPKGKTTWEGFVPPCKFKDGDIVVSGLGNIAIVSDKIGDNLYKTYCVLYRTDMMIDTTGDSVITKRFATEEEKEKLFKAIKENGYTWNDETKTLEKLPKFKEGDRIQGYGNHPIRVVKSLEWDRYRLDNGNYIKFGDEHAYKLLKFNIAALNPFDKVLVRYDNDNPWVAAHFSHYTKDAEWELPYFASGTCFRQCIPFEGNQHLLGTTNDCDEFYKTWE